ncbi:hypothetical protein K0M31_009584 [Melipona bicolor]|uniref:Uncharacterized protein n=1 Tax=Melipona bicolor TaxID=60889 RepID=A0AA40FND0_9HYME|nr:hypothetical protein K0M31_009584 [Melipona bicolor]
MTVHTLQCSRVLLSICGCLPPSSWTSSFAKSLYRIYTSFVWLLILSLVSAQILDIVINVENQDQFSDNFYITLVVFVSGCKLSIMLKHRRSILSLIDSLENEPFSTKNDDEANRDWLHDFSGGGRDIDIREIVLHGFQEEEIDFPGLVTLRLFGTVAICVQLRLRSYHFDAVLLPKCRLRHSVRWLADPNLQPVRDTRETSEKHSERRESLGEAMRQTLSKDIQSLQVPDMIFNSNWVSWDEKTKRILLLVMTRTTRPIEFTSGYLVTLNLESFVAVSIS